MFFETNYVIVIGPFKIWDSNCWYHIFEAKQTKVPFSQYMDL